MDAGTDKPMLLAALEHGGLARSAVIVSAGAAALDPLMFQWFNREAILCTDELASDNWFGIKMARHFKVTHPAGEYARREEGVHTNTAVGWPRLRGMNLPLDAGLRQVSVTQEPNGWQVSIQFEAKPKTYAVPTLPTVGLDAGLLDPAVLSDGRRVVRERKAEWAKKRAAIQPGA